MYYGILQGLARNIDQNTIIGVLHNMIKLRTESVWNFENSKIEWQMCLCTLWKHWKTNNDKWNIVLIKHHLRFQTKKLLNLMLVVWTFFFLVVKKKIELCSQINANANYNLNGYVRTAWRCIIVHPNFTCSSFASESTLHLLQASTWQCYELSRDLELCKQN